MSMRHCLQVSVGSQDSGAAEINRAYVAIKLWLLVIQTSDTVQGDARDVEINFDKESDNFAKLIWNELWPPFERIVTSFEADAINGNAPVSFNATCRVNADSVCSPWLS